MNSKESFEAILNNALRKRLAEMKNQEQFTFFWETKSPFSQWYKLEFTSKALDLSGNGLPAEFSTDLNFSSAEQFMMLHKALLFDDYESARKIHKTTNVRDKKLWVEALRVLMMQHGKCVVRKLFTTETSKSFHKTMKLKRN